VFADFIGAARAGIDVQALADQIEAGMDVAGSYDGPEMHNVVVEWQRWADRSPQAVAHLGLWNLVAPSLVEKRSVPFRPAGPHNLMHNKVASTTAPAAGSGPIARVPTGW
jgi:hypothetical protein